MQRLPAQFEDQAIRRVYDGKVETWVVFPWWTSFNR